MKHHKTYAKGEPLGQRGIGNDKFTVPSGFSFLQLVGIFNLLDVIKLSGIVATLLNRTQCSSLGKDVGVPSFPTFTYRTSFLHFTAGTSCCIASMSRRHLLFRRCLFVVKAPFSGKIPIVV
jgi:hypothetical protein